MVDQTTGYVIAIPCKRSNAETTISIVLNHLIYRFGLPRYIVSDNGRHIANKEFASFCKEHKIMHIKCLPFSPTSNSRVERRNADIKRYLEKFSDENKRNWDSLLPAACFALNNHVSRVTGYTPFFLVQGWEPRRHIDTILPELLLENGLSAEERALYAMETREIANARIGHHQQLRKEAYDKRHSPLVLRPGDMVLHKRRQKGSLESYWIGPFEIIEPCSETGYLVKALFDGPLYGKISRVHGKFLKRYYEEVNLNNPLGDDSSSDNGDDSDSPIEPPLPYVEVDTENILQSQELTYLEYLNTSYSALSYNASRDYQRLLTTSPIIQPIVQTRARVTDRNVQGLSIPQLIFSSHVNAPFNEPPTPLPPDDTHTVEPMVPANNIADHHHDIPPPIDNGNSSVDLPPAMVIDTIEQAQSNLVHPVIPDPTVFPSTADNDSFNVAPCPYDREDFIEFSEYSSNNNTGRFSLSSESSSDSQNESDSDSDHELEPVTPARSPNNSIASSAAMAEPLLNHNLETQNLEIPNSPHLPIVPHEPSVLASSSRSGSLSSVSSNPTLSNNSPDEQPNYPTDPVSPTVLSPEQSDCIGNEDQVQGPSELELEVEPVVPTPTENLLSHLHATTDNTREPIENENSSSSSSIITLPSFMHNVYSARENLEAFRDSNNTSPVIMNLPPSRSNENDDSVHDILSVTTGSDSLFLPETLIPDPHPTEQSTSMVKTTSHPIPVLPPTDSVSGPPYSSTPVGNISVFNFSYRSPPRQRHHSTPVAVLEQTYDIPPSRARISRLDDSQASEPIVGPFGDFSVRHDHQFIAIRPGTSRHLDPIDSSTTPSSSMVTDPANDPPVLSPQFPIKPVNPRNRKAPKLCPHSSIFRAIPTAGRERTYSGSPSRTTSEYFATLHGQEDTASTIAVRTYKHVSYETESTPPPSDRRPRTTDHRGRPIRERRAPDKLTYDQDHIHRQPRKRK